LKDNVKNTKKIEMNIPVLLDKTTNPNDEKLEEALKVSKSLFDIMIELTKSYKQEWKFYNKKSGWILKIFDKKKALLWIIPYDGYFLASMALRESEYKELLDLSETPTSIKEKLSEAKKYPEGHALGVEVHNDSDFDAIKFVVEWVMKNRK
jgi:predicted Zn-dependent protease